MEVFKIIVLFSFTFCKIVKPKTFVFFDAKTKFLQISCENSSIKDLSKFDDHLVKANHLKFVVCDEDLVSNTIKIAASTNSIDISNSKYKKLYTIGIEQRWTEFNASHNALEEIPNGFLQNATNLVQVDFSYNQLKKITPKTFEGANQIKIVNLSHNRITFVEIYEFWYLKNLERIDLSDNEIQWLFDSKIPVFDYPNKFRVLRLENNPIEELKSGYITTLNTVSASISWKYVTKFDLCCNQIMLYANLNYNDKSEGGIFPINKTIYEIRCNERSFRRIDEFSAISNLIENVSELLRCFGQTLTSIFIDGNTIKRLNATTFKRFILLEKLVLIHTQLIEFDLSILTSTRLKYIDLSFNWINNINNANKLQDFKNLNEFKITGNHLQNTAELIHHLTSLDQFELLDVSDNYVGEIKHFTKESNLRTLYLSNTNLTIADFQVITKMSSRAILFNERNVPEQINMSSLKTLDVSYNNLEITNFTLLSELQTLEYFNAAHCNIKNISSVIQYLSGSLETLDLSGNKGIDIDSKSFIQFFELKSLNLSDTNIWYIEYSTFAYQTELRTLDLSKNRLQYFNFHVPGTIEKLNLNDNKLYNVYFSRYDYPLLETLSISNNYLSCENIFEVKRNLPDVIFPTDPLKQKHSFDCYQYNETEAKVHTESETLNTYAIVIIIPIVFVIIIFTAAVTFFYVRVDQKTSDPGVYLLDMITNDMNTDMNGENPVYSEILQPDDEPVYDQLDFSLRLSSKQQLRHYDTINSNCQ